MGFFFRQYSGIASLACCVRNKKKIFMVVMCYADDKWVIKDLFFLTLFILIIIVLKPGPARRVDPRLEPGRVDEKIRKVMSRCDPADPVNPTKPGQKLGCNPLIFFY